jgi:hypothetical protein
MPANNLPFRIWCLLITGVFLFEVLPGPNWIYTSVAIYDKSRWLHFLVYLCVVAIPFAAWRNRTNVLLSLIPPFVTYALEYVQSSVYGPHIRYRNLSADLFGIAAGILLGLNLRVLRSSGMRFGETRSPSGPTTS